MGDIGIRQVPDDIEIKIEVAVFTDGPDVTNADAIPPTAQSVLVGFRRMQWVTKTH
jgi:hypothetical protein